MKTARMLAKHHDLAITSEQRFRFASLMSLAADDAKLPEDPEFRSAFMAYVEWGTRLAQHNSQPGAAVVEHAPVPRWGWPTSKVTRDPIRAPWDACSQPDSVRTALHGFPVGRMSLDEG